MTDALRALLMRILQEHLEKNTQLIYLIVLLLLAMWLNMLTVLLFEKPTFEKPKLHMSIALSTREAEYMALSTAICEVILLVNLTAKLHNQRVTLIVK
jgi:hypothetical protein